MQNLRGCFLSVTLAMHRVNGVGESVIVFAIPSAFPILIPRMAVSEFISVSAYPTRIQDNQRRSRRAGRSRS